LEGKVVVNSTLRSHFQRDESKRLLSVLAAAIVFVVRSGQQFSNPTLWAEEVIVLLRYSEGGWTEALRPISGQFIPISTIPIVLGAQHLAVMPWVLSISSLLVFMVTCRLFLGNQQLDADSSLLVGPILLALVPVGPEAFGVGLYNFWWASLWPPALLLWNLKQRRSLVLGCALIVAASFTALSAAIAGLALMPIGALSKSRRRMVLGMIALPGFVVQYLVSRERATPPRVGIPTYVIDTLHFLGKAVWTRSQWNGTYPDAISNRLTALTGLSLLVLVFVGSRHQSTEERWTSRGLVSVATGFGLLSVFARPGEKLHPYAAGPRYFLLGTVLLLVTLLRMTKASPTTPPVVRKASVILLLMTLASLPMGFVRNPPVEPIDWKSELDSCAASSGLAPLRSQEDGYQKPWSFDFDARWCRDKLGRSWQAETSGFSR
jgi:hypothetical protein